MAAELPAQPFAGRWDLTIQEANHKQLPSWLELTVDRGVWKASFVGRWGNSRPLPKVVVQGNKIQQGDHGGIAYRNILLTQAAP
jgi:hypothetical protein